MVKIVECVPNFSEGRRPEVINEIVRAIQSVPGVAVLDVEADADHNRSVVTFVGEPAACLEAAFAGCAAAARLINMEEHRGSHPRIGATDVIPFVPVKNVTMAECVELAARLGRRIAEELGIPVYLYGEAARRPERKSLPNIRRGQYEGLKSEIARPERHPDFGPPRLHPTAGATCVGARPFLIAYNVNLNTPDVTVAQRIAEAVREKDGGLTNVRAIGIYLSARHQAQVSMNLLDPGRTPVHRVLELVRREAARYGVSVTGTEIVGLVPAEALLAAAAYYLQLENFDPARQVLEFRLHKE
ncbi:glutamate formimidoyltransferase [Desulfovirgula thermocuniculi]|uniref:glutamate formimidoyltransferase n=1 Tax=Desulfovirgula thermocuniculi TaxID=348842 RepID=UPI0004223941|nr:glutamate formimidoyltransferase [Desulfovirgula thermocuniculi]